MKKTLWLTALIIVALAVAKHSIRPAEAQTAVTLQETTEISTSTPDVLNRSQRAWMGALEWCESRGRPEAVNPKDSDGTPSYGILQFKPGTYSDFTKKYQTGSTTDYRNPDGQEKILVQMILRNDVNFRQQFPDCTRKLGYPPVKAFTRTDK